MNDTDGFDVTRRDILRTGRAVLVMSTVSHCIDANAAVPEGETPNDALPSVIPNTHPCRLVFGHPTLYLTGNQFYNLE